MIFVSRAWEKAAGVVLLAKRRVGRLGFPRLEHNDGAGGEVEGLAGDVPKAFFKEKRVLERGGWGEMGKGAWGGQTSLGIFCIL